MLTTGWPGAPVSSLHPEPQPTAEVCDKLASEGEGCGVQSKHLKRSFSGNTTLVSIHNPWHAVPSWGKHCIEKTHESKRLPLLVTKRKLGML